MCVPTISSLGSLFLLFSFILELFILIGQVGNSSFLRKLNFIVATNKPKNLTYTTGLWNYCQGNFQGVINTCSKAKPAFNWVQAPAVAQALPNKSKSKMVSALFLAMFCLFFIGCGFSFILWLLSLPVCFLKRRGLHFSMGTFVFINFLVMLAALVLALVMVISGCKELHNADNNWNGRAGDSLWVTIGAVVSLLLATIFYSGSGICAGKKSKVVADPNVKVETYPQDIKFQQSPQNPNYIASNVYVPHNQYQPDIKYSQQQLPNPQQDVYYHVAQPGYTTVHTEPYSGEKKTIYVSGQAVDPYTGKPIQNQQQPTVDVKSPTVASNTVPSQTVNTTDSVVSGQVPNTVDPNGTTTTTTTTYTYTYDPKDVTTDASGNKVIYVPTDQGPVPVNVDAVSNNLQTVDANGNPIAKP